MQNMLREILYRLNWKSHLWFVGLVCVCFGCREDTQIETVTVPLSKSGLPIAIGDSRMVVATAVRPKATWFFKLTGPVTKIDENERDWIEFLKTIKFDQTGNPVWKLPENWKPLPDRQMRFATLALRGDPEMEIAISSLGPDFDRLFNFNRWRGQLGLPPIKESELDDEIGTLEYTDGEFLIFDRTGTFSSSMTPPFASGQTSTGSPATGLASNSDSANDASTPDSGDIIPFRFQLPETWSDGQKSPFVAALFQSGSGDLQVEIKITPLPAELARWNESVASWIGETGGTGDPKALDSERSKTIQIDGQEAKRIDLLDLPGSSKGVTGVRMEHQNVAWYIKMTGNPEAVNAQLVAFDAFIDSIKFVKE